MKTAISIPDHLYEQAERAAQRLGFNRSQFYARAIEAYLAAQEEDPVTARLDELAEEMDSHAVANPARALIDSGAWEW